MKRRFDPRLFILLISFAASCLITRTPVWSQSDPQAQGLFIPIATGIQPTSASLMQRGTQRARLVAVNFEQFGIANAQGAKSAQERSSVSKSLTLNFFDDVVLTADLDEIEPRMLADDGFVWIGRIRGYPFSSAVVTAGGGQIHVLVNMGLVGYEVTYAGNNLHLVREINTNQPPIGDDAFRITPSDGSTFSGSNLKTAPVHPIAADGSFIDVMILYANGAYASVVNDTGMLNQANSVIALANQSFINSQINPAPRFRLVHVYHSSYTEQDSLSADLDRLRQISDGNMDEVHQLRDFYHADIVAMITNPAAPNRSGFGYVLPESGTSASFQNYGFSVTANWAFAINTLTHEMGHNLGSDHNIEDAGLNSFRPYSHGYRVEGSFSTIMAYGCSFCVEVNYWSNQILTYDGHSMGAPNADNRQSLLEAYPIVANFRDSTGDGSCPAPVISYADGVTFFGGATYFKWLSSGGCTIQGYELRVKDTSNMDVGGTTLLSVTRAINEFDYNPAIDPAWFDHDLYVGVRVANALVGAQWAVRRFRVDSTPDVRIALPVNGGTYADPIIHIQASVDSNMLGIIDNVQFRVTSTDAWAGGQSIVLGSDTSFPYTWDWDISGLPNTTTATITAVVFDSTSNMYPLPDADSSHITINKSATTSTPLPTNTATITPSVTPTRTASATFIFSPTPSLTASATATYTESATSTASATSSPTATLTSTRSMTSSATASSTATRTVTTTSTASATPSATASLTSTRSMTPSATASVSPTTTRTPTVTATSTLVALHPDTIGIFRSNITTFFLRNSNTTGFADSSITFGASTDFPITGDWNGDGTDTAGVYRQTTGQFFLTDSTANPAILSYSLVLGVPNDQPIVGDWDGDGKDGVGVFRPSNGLIYLKNGLTTGFADLTMVLGIPGDIGIAGDWNGDGKDSPGVYRPSNQVFYLTNSICNCSVFADAQLGLGIAGDTPFVGDWDGDGKSGVGVYRQSNGLTYIKNGLTTGFADASFVFGSASDYPLAGYWVRVSPPSALEPAPTFQAAP